MSFMISAACVRLKMPGVAKNVLMQLADIANDHGYAWPSIDTLCMRTCWGRTAVIDAINFLEANGALRPDRSSGRNTKYWITPGSWKGEQFPDKDSSDPSAKRTGTPNGPVRQTDPTRPPNGPHPSAKRTLISKNPTESEIHPLPPEGGESVGKPENREREPSPTGFEAFAAEYPRRTGIDAARRVWQHLNPGEQLQAEIARAVQAWKRSDEWRRDEGRFVPKAGKWLRDQRWLDAPGTAAPSPQPVATPAPRALTPEQMQANKRKAAELVAMARASAGQRGRQPMEAMA